MSRVYVINWRIKLVKFQFCWYKPHHGSMCWEGVVSISNFLKNILHFVLQLHPVIILIIVFHSLRTLLLLTDFPQNMKPLSITAWEYLLTPWNRVFLEKLTSFQQVKKFPTFYGTWRFITVFTSACHLSLSKVSVRVWGFLCEHFVTRYIVSNSIQFNLFRVW